jgi:hypothetical protein
LSFAERFFVSSVLLIDETSFARVGIINIRNHQCAEEIPYGVVYSRHQQQFTINVLAGIDRPARFATWV